MPATSKVRRRHRRLLGHKDDALPGRHPFLNTLLGHIGGTRYKRKLQDAVRASDLVTYEFQASPRMSSYLVAFIIGELSHVTMTCEAGASKQLPVSVWATPDRCESYHCACVP